MPSRTSVSCNAGGAFGGNGAGGGNVGFGEGLAGELLKVHALRPMIDEILRQSGFVPDDDSVVGAVTGKSNGAAVPAPAPTLEKTNAADL